MKKTTRIIIERDELFILSRGASAERRQCGECGLEVEMVAPEVAAAVAGVGARAVYHLLESGRLHFMETPEGAVLICPNSLGELVADSHLLLRQDACE